MKDISKQAYDYVKNYVWDGMFDGKHNSKIKWVGHVHEVLTGFKENSVKLLPLEEKYTLMHNKKIEKQEQQNSFYETI